MRALSGATVVHADVYLSLLLMKKLFKKEAESEKCMVSQVLVRKVILKRLKVVVAFLNSVLLCRSTILHTSYNRWQSIFAASIWGLELHFQPSYFQFFDTISCLEFSADNGEFHFQKGLFTSCHCNWVGV